MVAQQGDGRGPPPDVLSAISSRASAYSSFQSAVVSSASVASVQSVVSEASLASVQSVAAQSIASLQAAEETQDGVAAAATTSQPVNVSLTGQTTLDVGEGSSSTGYGVSASTSATATAIETGYGGESSTTSPTLYYSTPTSVPSTFATTTHSPISEGDSSSQTATSPPPARSSDPVLAVPETTQRAHSNELSPGATAAAVLLPLLFLLCLILAFLYGRYRRRNNSSGSAPSNSNASPTAFAPVAMKQRRSLLGRRSHPAPISPPSPPPPIVTSLRNPTYNTGLSPTTTLSTQPSQRSNASDYPARTSLGGTFYHPPPAYKQKKTSSDSAGKPPSYNLPALDFSPAHDRGESWSDPFADPESPVSPVRAVENTGFLAAPTAAAAGIGADGRPGVSRSTSNRSFSSEMYSETASVHSARAARVSVAGGPVLVGDDPFGDGGQRNGSS